MLLARPVLERTCANALRRWLAYSCGAANAGRPWRYTCPLVVLLTWACANGGARADMGVSGDALARTENYRTATTPKAKPSGLTPAKPLELTLVRALPIAGWDNFQPSGLLWQAGKLLTVSDKHDEHIFELLLDEHQVTVRVHQTFQRPPDVTELDLEGLSSDRAGGLLIACETPIRILHVRSDSTSSWYTPPLYAVGARVGLFQLRNATVEGVALLEDGRLLAAAERSDRGLIEIPASRDLRGALAWSMPRSQFVLGGTRLPDFSDLAVSGNEVFALIRNGHLIVRMRRTSTSWLEAQAWSFAHSENASGHAYFDRRYGVAEGLAFDENFIYVVLDNNQDGRLVKPADVRPQLMVFNRPQSFAKR